MSHAKTRPIVAAAAAALLAPGLAAAQPADAGRVERIRVHGKSLEGNLMGFPPERDVFMYLPPSYDDAPNRRYPVVYSLHGWLPDAEQWIGTLDFEGIAIDIGLQDGLLADNRALHETLSDYGIAHQYETYEGNHTNRVAERFEGSVLPFFSKHLEFEE